MRASLVCWALLSGVAIAACSASSGSGSGNPLFNNGTGGSGASSDASLSAGAVFGGGGEGNPFIPTGDGSNGTAGTSGDGSCNPLVSKPEESYEYHDATVTDTIIEYSKVAIYIMQDRSSSMVGLTGDPSSWPNSSNAISAFVDDQNSTGIDVGLGVFPPMSNQGGDCTAGADCGSPVVPIASLPGNASAMKNAMQSATPPIFPILFTPTECAIKGMLAQCQQFMQQSGGEKCVALLVTDGQPTTCDTNAQNLVNLVAQGKAAGVQTFALGLPGSNLGFLNDIANAGGTGQAIDATQGGAAGEAAFLAALNSIRDKVAHTTSHQVTTQTVIKTKLPCEWTIPNPDSVQPGKVNVQFTPDTTVQPPQVIDYGHVPPDPANPDPAANCARAGDGWYYDNETAPTKVFVCPNTCTTITAAPNPIVNLVFGCKTKDVLFQ